jgi:hypothetical protein
MTVDRTTESRVVRTISMADILLDGLFTGMIGALAVALWFLVLDVAAGHPLYTPALLGNVLLHGGQAVAQPVVIEPLPIAAYTGFHFVVFMLVGVWSHLMACSGVPRSCSSRCSSSSCTQVGFFAMTDAQLTGRLRA